MADLFLFLGEPKDLVSEYTALTGRATMPPRWSFGLWMGRDTYESAGEVKAVASRLRRERVPCDVLHVDTGWTDVKFRVDFEFSTERFPEPERFLDELREQGFRLSLWQYPYLHPNNRLHREAVERGFVVLGSDGLPPVDDAVIDLTNEDAAEWYTAEDEGTALAGPGWHTLAVEEVPAAVLVRDGAAVRMTEPAQHTGELDWDGAREWRPAG